MLMRFERSKGAGYEMVPLAVTDATLAGAAGAEEAIMGASSDCWALEASGAGAGAGAGATLTENSLATGFSLALVVLVGADDWRAGDAVFSFLADGDGLTTLAGEDCFGERVDDSCTGAGAGASSSLELGA